MPTNVIYPEWRDETKLTRFPFEEGATLVSQSGYTFPVEAVLDAHFYPVGSSANVYLYSVDVDLESGIISFAIASANKILATATLVLPYSTELLAFYDEYGRPAGLAVVSSDIEILKTWGNGTHSFAATALPFVSAVVTPMPQVALNGFIVNGEIFAGDVYVVGDRGVVVRKDDGKLRIDICGEVFANQRECKENIERIAANTGLGVELPEGLNAVVDPILLTINSTPPGSNLTFDIVTETRRVPLRITTENNQVIIELIK